ncbi:MAG: class I SAM-dependent methyltransferase [Chloroflexales bacterium]|nr:class I SAM-dependent methyltransferase [Chloroflexales bacterium]
MSIYRSYAPLYDGSGQIRFALLMGQYLREVRARHLVGGRRALDVACGTGTLALLLADEGWDVLGVDLSAPMLDQARHKAATIITAGHTAFAQGDMRHLAENPAVPHGSFDLATCTYDSLNYLLTPDDLLACFSGVAHALAPGGLFVGDMNTRHFLEFDWGTCEVQEHSGYVQIGQSSFDPADATSTLVLTGFVGDDEHGYERFDEIHVERAYDQATVEALLRQAGFVVEGAYDSFTFQPPGERTQRIVWVARKHVAQL